MKNAALHPLLLATLLFLAFLSGILFARVFPGNTVQLSSANKPSVQTPTTDTSVSDEVYVDGKLNINAASAEDLTLLPGIGKTIADRIVAYRMEYGNFITIDQLKNVKGIGDIGYSKIEQYITTGG